MVVFSNRRLGPVAELLVSAEVAGAMLRGTADAARAAADGRWEHELARWLADHARRCDAERLQIDVGDIAWSPDHFEHQRRFLLAIIDRASGGTPDHARAFLRWARLIEAHPRESVQVGRRWVTHSMA